VGSWVTPTGAHAAAVEQEVLRWWREEIKAPIALSQKEMSQGGFTETASELYVRLSATKARIEHLTAEVGEQPTSELPPFGSGLSACRGGAASFGGSHARSTSNLICRARMSVVRDTTPRWSSRVAMTSPTITSATWSRLSAAGWLVPPTCRPAGQDLGAVTSHSFRKSVATLIDDEGLSARIGADHLGHARVSETQDTYTARGRSHQAVVDLLDRAISDE
jgi:hypothetical protein